MFFHRQLKLAVVALVLSAIVSSSFAFADQVPEIKHTPPTSAKTGKDIPLNVTIDRMYTEIWSVSAFWGTEPDSAMNEVVLKPMDTNKTSWAGTIPGQVKSGKVWYFLKVTYYYNNSLNDLYLPSQTQRYPVDVEGSWFSNMTIPGVVIGVTLLVAAFIALEWGRRARPKWNDREFEDSVKTKDDVVELIDEKKDGPTEPRQPS